MGISRIHRFGLILLLALFAAETPAAPTVVGYQLVSKKRSGRATVDYTYRVLISNPGPALIEVSGTVASSSASTQVLSGPVIFGDVSAGGRVRSTGTMTIRQDRTAAYNPSVLSWSFVGFPGEGVPPDPGVASTLTAEGVDSDADGVRDDIERFIARTYSSSAKVRRALLQFAADYQLVMQPAVSAADAIAKTEQIFGSVDCVAFVSPASYEHAVGLVERELLNTLLRLRADADFDELVGGHVFSFSNVAPGAAACRFDTSQFDN